MELIMNRLRTLGRRALFVQNDREQGSESGANILVTNIIGIIVGLTFLGVGIAAVIGALDSSKSGKAKEIMGNDIATQVHSYYLDHQALPGNGTAADVVTAMAGYFSVTPCDPLDAACTPASAASDFTMISGLTAGNQPDYVIFDTVAHPAKNLTGIPKYGGLGVAPVANCTACTKFVYDAIFGVEGQ